MQALERYGATGTDPALFQRVVTLANAFDDVVVALRQQIAAAGLWVLAEIDPAHFLQRGGYRTLSIRQILFFHPDILVVVLGADVSALAEAPLKFVITEMPDGAVTVRWFDPEPQFRRYGSPVLNEIGKRLAGNCAAIIERASAVLSTTP